MAPKFFSPCIILSLAIIFSLSHTPPLAALEFKVGDDDGWEVPSDKSDFYNSWASKNRFQVGDSLQFEFKKESVMEVSSAEEYEHCNSSRPYFFSNNSPTTIELDRPGLFYFISGVAGHCEKGVKMIVKVLGHSPSTGDSASPPGGDYNPPPDSTDDSAATVPMARIAYAVIIQMFMLVLGFSLP